MAEVCIVVQMERKLEQHAAVLVKLADRADGSNADAAQLREQLAALQGEALPHDHCFAQGSFFAPSRTTVANIVWLL